MRLFTVAIVAAAALAGAALFTSASSVDACAGLIGSNGAVNLGRTTTLAAYHDGTEHYVTSFQFEGGGGEFGSLIPLPAVPTKVERGGGWTLQRLQLETQAVLTEDTFRAASAVGYDAEVLLEVRIDALDITVLKGGGPDVATWAQEHGFRLSPDAPEVLDFYASRSPIFLAAVFDGEAAASRGQQIGDGTPVHITMPTENPWVPLRILALGKQASDRVDADVFLLTDEQPALLPAPGDGLALSHSDSATSLLLDDLRSDDGMAWVPTSAWLTKLQVDTAAGDLNYDSAIDATGARSPSPVDAGLQLPSAPTEGGYAVPIAWTAAIAGLAVIIALAARRLRPAAAPER